jgi:hypothetical protein
MKKFFESTGWGRFVFSQRLFVYSSRVKQYFYQIYQVPVLVIEQKIEDAGRVSFCHESGQKGRLDQRFFPLSLGFEPTNHDDSYWWTKVKARASKGTSIYRNDTQLIRYFWRNDGFVRAAVPPPPPPPAPPLLRPKNFGSKYLGAKYVSMDGTTEMPARNGPLVMISKAEHDEVCLGGDVCRAHFPGSAWLQRRGTRRN